MHGNSHPLQGMKQLSFTVFQFFSFSCISAFLGTAVGLSGGITT